MAVKKPVADETSETLKVTLIADAEIAGKPYKKDDQPEVTPAQRDTLIRLKAVAADAPKS